MSSLASLSRHKRRPPPNDVDRISNLPESVRSYILSFLPAEEAVATSLLSKRWRFLWRNIHNLTFNDQARQFSCGNKIKNIKFSHFVSRVLIFLNQQNIEKFSLLIEEYCEAYDVTTWIAAAVARQVKALDFDICYSDPPIQLPCSLFTCKSLEQLVLIGAISVDVPSSICLPNLEFLQLQYVIYQCDGSLHKLISGCPKLETLCIRREEFNNVVKLTISSPTLINLNIAYDHVLDSSPAVHNYKLEINAPALKYLNLCDTFPRDFSVVNLCSLEEAEVKTQVIKDGQSVPLSSYDDYSKSVVKLLQVVHNVKHLSLRGDILEALSHAGVIPSFRRVACLTVEAEYCGWNSLLDLVKYLNELEFLSFTQHLGHKDAHLTCWSEPQKAPICLLLCFQRMSIYQFKGLEDELAMIAYILKNAKILRTFTIEAANHLDLEVKFQLLQKISKFPRESRTCEIVFS